MGENKQGGAKSPLSNNLTNSDELLKYAIENGIIDLQCVQEQVNMNKKKAIISEHPYSITYNNNKGRWYTRFNENGKVIQRNRKTREELEDLIVAFYTNGGFEETQNNIYTFSQAHDKWLDMQNEYGKSSNTIYKYEADWRRFFDGTNFSKKDLTSITPQDIEVFVISKIKELNLKRQAGIALYGYIDGVFYTAVMDRIISANDNPCLYVDKKKFHRHYNTDEKTTSQRTMGKDDISALIEKLENDSNDPHRLLKVFGVKLSLLTGMRSGEICGLKWEHVFEDHIHICESEKYNSQTKEYFQSKTKNKKVRDIPITDGLKTLINAIKDYQKVNGIFEDFVISMKGEKLRTRKLSDYMVKTSKKLGFECSKNIHTIRRTFNSYLRDGGVSASTAGSIIGNTAQVNTANYTYDVLDMNQKRDFILNAETRILGENKLFS